MTDIDVVSGFLGAGKTTLIKKLLKDALSGTKTVLIENEFGEIGIDGGFLKDSGIEIKEMNSGCICCSLVGDFGTSLKEVVEKYSPDRILIEPSGVGKLSDVLKAVENVASDMNVRVNSAVAVVDATKCKMYIKNFGEFFVNQIEYAGTIILTRTDKASMEKINECVKLIREHNQKATIITTHLDSLDGKDVLKTIEGADKLEDMLAEMLKEEDEHRHHHHDDEECGCHHHDHDEHCHHEHDDDEHCHHHDHDDEECCHHHDHDHHHDDDEECCHHHHHDDDEECCHHHDHEHHHGHDEECCHHHDHDHDHDHDCGCHDHDHHHHHHHADEVFTSWGMETPNKYSREDLERILTALDSGEYGMILRAKGMVESTDGTWIYYDYVPEEQEIRTGKPEVTGKICVIGSKLNEEKLKELFS
ncbi:MAG: GTP-binding protein [Lachnospiraceae bacterium]|nr:GTP-binding protein [Lachnospiraceae bacterium]